MEKKDEEKDEIILYQEGNDDNKNNNTNNSVSTENEMLSLSEFYLECARFGELEDMKNEFKGFWRKYSITYVMCKWSFKYSKIFN